MSGQTTHTTTEPGKPSDEAAGASSRDVHEASPDDHRRQSRKAAPRQAGSLKGRLFLADSVAFAFGVLLTFAIQYVLRPVPRSVMSAHLLLVAASIPGFAFGAAFNKLYKARANERRIEEAHNVFKTVGVGMSMLLLISVAVQYTQLSRLWVVLLGLSITSSMLIERRLIRSWFARMRRDGLLKRRIVIVGTDAHAIGMMHAYERNPSLGYEVVGFAGEDDLGARGGVEVLGPIEDLADLLEEHRAIGVVVSLASVASDEVNRLTRRLTDDGYHVALSSSLRDIDVTRLRPQSLDGRTMIYVEPVVRNGWQTSAKRAFDIGLALTIMTLTLPVQIISALAIALTSRGPVFFRQIRVGRDGELFEVLKYRTMYLDAEERKAGLMKFNEMDGPLFKISNDPRITKVGRVLRKLSIDELPQLVCVLIGSMSMVGPRPALPSEFEEWDDDVRDRLRVLPGLTGMWQVSGRSDASFETYKRMDLYYVDNWSLLHDLKICARTVGVVLTCRGAT